MKYICLGYYEPENSQGMTEEARTRDVRRML